MHFLKNFSFLRKTIEFLISVWGTSRIIMAPHLPLHAKANKYLCIDFWKHCVNKAILARFFQKLKFLSLYSKDLNCWPFLRRKKFMFHPLQIFYNNQPRSGVITNNSQLSSSIVMKDLSKIEGNSNSCCRVSIFSGTKKRLTVTFYFFNEVDSNSELCNIK